MSPTRGFDQHQWISFISQLPVAAAIFDREMRYLATSDLWLKDYGLQGQNVVGRSHYEIFKNIPEKWKSIHQECLAGASREANEDPFISNSGVSQWLKWTVKPWLNSEDEVGGIIMVTEDVTERTLLKAQARADAERLRLALKAANASTWEWDIETGKTFWGDGIYHLYGYESDCGIDVNEIALKGMGQAGFNDVLEACREAMTKDGRMLLDFHIRRSDGAMRTLRTEGSVIFRANGEAERILGVTRDVTAEREEEARRIQQSKMSSLGEMAAGVAHEINNPLTIINGKAQQMESLLKKGAFSPEDFGRHLETIRKTTTRIAKIIRGMRTFARDAEQDPFEETFVQALVEDAVSFCDTRFKNHGIELHLPQIPPDLRMQCRPAQVLQVIVNLLSNAHDALEDEDQKWVKLEVNDLGDAVEWAVADCGPGISKELHERIFQPFFTTKTVGKGTGLGLSISSGIVKIHGGSLQLDSSSAFTRFVATFPKTQDHQRKLPKAA